MVATERNFNELVQVRWVLGHHVCLGLDPDYDRIPEFLKSNHGCGPSPSQVRMMLLRFLKPIIEATHQEVCSYKLNAAYFECLGSGGFDVQQEIVHIIREIAPEVPVIYDCKREDAPHSSEKYARTAFDYVKADAVTIGWFFGKEGNQPFLDRTDKGIFVLCSTSNEGADEFQNIDVRIDYDEYRKLEELHASPYSFGSGGGHTSLSNHIAYQVMNRWNANGNCGLVAGATHRGRLASVRRIAGEMPLLIPGIGEQGGNLRETVEAARTQVGQGMIINISRSALFASQGEDFADAALRKVRTLNEEIRGYLA